MGADGYGKVSSCSFSTALPHPAHLLNIRSVLTFSLDSFILGSVFQTSFQRIEGGYDNDHTTGSTG